MIPSSSYTDGEVLAIQYNVWISGSQLDLERKKCIESVEIKETTEGSDTATIVIRDPEFIFIEDNIFVEDNTIKIEMFWTGTTYKETFEGYISAIDIEFADDGIPTLTINCMDNTHIMNREKKNNTFKNMTSAQVVQSIVQSYGFQCVVESNYGFEAQESISQSNQTDIDFINQLAGDEVYPFTARLVGNTFYYIKRGTLSDPVMTLHYVGYPHEIISFSPSINKESKQLETKSSKVDSTKKVSTASVAGSGSDSKMSKGGGVSNSGQKTYNPNRKYWQDGNKADAI